MSKSGVQEWANHSINLQYTCEYGCRYCYARKLNNRFKFTPKEPVIKHYNGVVMFPTMHDITLSNFDKVSDTIEKLLEFDNKILIVSKMSLNIAQKFVERFMFHPKKLNIEFRITITLAGDSEFRINVRKYFESKAPDSCDRFEAVNLLLRQYFNASISCEPLLSNFSHILSAISSFAGGYMPALKSVWIGCLTNYKLNPNISEEKEVIELYKTLPEIYEEYKQYDFIKFKDSFFKAMDREIKRRKNGGSK